jgi:alpha-1,6-mannosyltransferase
MKEEIPAGDPLAESGNPSLARPKVTAVHKLILAGLGSGLLYFLLHESQRGILYDGIQRNQALSRGLDHTSGGNPLLTHVLGYYGAVIGLFAVYFLVLSLCRRGELDDSPTRVLAILFPVLFILGYLWTRPYLSIDLLSYVAQGHLATVPGQNPYSHGAKIVVDTPLGSQLIDFGWRPVHGVSPYGPLWTQLEILAVKVTGSISGAVLLLKAFVVAAALASALLIWKILGRIRPAAQMLGTVLFLWNPLIIVEFGGEGHNDAAMIMFVLAALFFWLSRRAVFSYLAIGLGVLTKYLPLMFMPALVFQLWPGKGHWRRFASQILVALILGSLVALVLYRPLWIGRETFSGVFLMGQAEHSSTLPSGILYWLFKLFMPAAKAGGISSKIISIPFAIFVLAMSWILRDKRKLNEVFLYISLSYMLLGASIYWPWYACLPLALLALSPSRLFVSLALVVSFCSRLVAPLDSLIRTGLLTPRWSFVLTSAIGTTLPLLVIILWIWRRKPSGSDQLEQPRILENI